MGFKDVVQADVQSVFLNLSDFAENHVIDGVNIVCVVNSDANAQIKNGRILGNNEYDLEVFGKTEDLQFYCSGKIINVDGQEYYVEKVNEQMGVIQLMLKETGSI